MKDYLLTGLLWILHTRFPQPVPVASRWSQSGLVLLVGMAGLMSLSACNVSPQPLGLKPKTLTVANLPDPASAPKAPTGTPVGVGGGNPLGGLFGAKKEATTALKLADELLSMAVDPFLIKLPLPPDAIPMEEPKLPGDSNATASVLPGGGAPPPEGSSIPNLPNLGAGLATTAEPEPGEIASSMHVVGISVASNPAQTMAILQTSAGSQYVRPGETLMHAGYSFQVVRIQKDFVEVASLNAKGKRTDKTQLRISNIIGYHSSSNTPTSSSGTAAPASSATLSSQLDSALSSLGLGRPVATGNSPASAPLK